MGNVSMYSVSVIFFISLWCTIEVLGGSGGCSMYNVNIKHIKNCESKKYPYFQLINITASLTDDCKMIPKGCFRIKKGVDSDAMIEWKYSGKFGNKSDKKPLCEGLENEKIQDGLKPYDDMRDMHCPLEEGVKCYRGGFNSLESVKNYMGMAVGNHAIEILIYKRGAPEKAFCMKVDVTISKNGMG